MRKAEWQPEESKVFDCERMWHIASLLKGTCHHAKKFGDYHALKKNSNSWSNGVPEYLRNNWGEAQSKRVESYEEFCTWAGQELDISVKAYTRK